VEKRAVCLERAESVIRIRPVNLRDMKIESKIGKSTSSDRKIYEFITDFNNFRELLPDDKVTGWESTSESCSFRVDPVGRTGMKIVQKEPCSLVKVASDPEVSSYQFTIWIQIKRVADGDTRVKITIEPHVSMMVMPMIKSPLKEFADGLIDKLESFEF
jgi:carbon monoxide dehydrogenase subunit G